MVVRPTEVQRLLSVKRKASTSAIARDPGIEGYQRHIDQCVRYARRTERYPSWLRLNVCKCRWSTGAFDRLRPVASRGSGRSTSEMTGGQLEGEGRRLDVRVNRSVMPERTAGYCYARPFSSASTHASK